MPFACRWQEPTVTGKAFALFLAGSCRGKEGCGGAPVNAFFAVPKVPHTQPQNPFQKVKERFDAFEPFCGDDL